MDLHDLQSEIKTWSKYNFGNVPRWEPLLGAVEEIGELAHAFLKAEQGIRGTPEDFKVAEQDAIGDIIIYLADFCWRSEYDLTGIIESTWSEVKKRDWKRYPQKGYKEGILE